jgi:hypothetical protein
LNHDSYVVLDTDGRRDFTFTRRLKNLYIFKTVLIGLIAVFAFFALPDILAKDGKPSLRDDNGDLTRLAVALATIGVFLLSLGFTILLSVGPKNNWRWPILIISSLTIVIHLVLAGLVLFYVLENFKTNGSQYQGVGAIIIICLAIAFSIRSLGEVLKFIPGVSLFSNGVLIENFKEWELPIIAEMLAGMQMQESGHLAASKVELWNSITEAVESGANFRVARFDDEIIGFLMNGKSLTRPGSINIGILCVYDSPIAYQVASHLVRDFVRLYSRSSKPVGFITVPSKFDLMYEAFLSNGWVLTEGNKATKTMSFKYVGLPSLQ